MGRGLYQDLEENKQPNSQNTQLPIVAQTQNEYAQPWTFKKVFIEFNKKAIPFSVVRMLDTVAEVGSGYLFALYGGANYLAANNLIIVSNRFFLAPATASFFSLPARYHEIKADDEKVGTLIRQGFTSACLLTLVDVPILLCSGKIFKAIGLNPDICDIVQDFYIGAAAYIPTTIFSAVVQQFTLLVGRQNDSLTINALNNALSVALGSVLMFGKLGSPELGARGLGYGYSIASAITLTTYFLYFKLTKDFKKYNFFRPSLKDLNKFYELIKEASPFSLQMAADFLLSYLGAIMAGLLSDEALSASRIAEMVYILILSYHKISSNNEFNGSPGKTSWKSTLLNQVINANLLSMFLLVTVWSITANFLSNPLTNLFTKNDQISSLAKDLFWIYPLSLLPEITRYTASGALRAFKDFKISMYNSVVWLAGIGSGSIYLGYQYGQTLNWIYGARTLALTGGGANYRTKLIKKYMAILIQKIRKYSMVKTITRTNSYC